MSQFVNKVAIITGASSGIGRATAIHLASLGCSLSLNGRNRKNLDTVKVECLNGPGKLKDDQVLILDGDIKEEKNCQKLVEDTVKHFGKIDILINNAGIIAKGTVENTSLATFDEVLNINLRVVYLLTQLTIPHLKKTKGNIVNVSSVNGLRSFPGVAVYNVSKSALDQLTRCTALELAADGVRVNSVNPGVIATEIHKRGGMNDSEYKAFMERSKTTHPLGRPGNADEVANAIRFLADNRDASFITGVTLSVDGGRHLTCLR